MTFRAHIGEVLSSNSAQVKRQCDGDPCQRSVLPLVVVGAPLERFHAASDVHCFVKYLIQDRPRRGNTEHANEHERGDSRPKQCAMQGPV
jgi:hypothetical protein